MLQNPYSSHQFFVTRPDEIGEQAGTLHVESSKGSEKPML